MSATTYITELEVPNPWGEGTHTERHIEITRNQRDGLCQGRVAGDWRTTSCDKKAKETHVVTIKIVRRGADTEVVQNVSVGFCGTHDPVRKAARKQKRRQSERAEYDVVQDRKARLQSDVEMTVAAINAAAGETVVRVGYSGHDFRDRYPTVQVIKADPLIAALRNVAQPSHK